MTRKDVTIAGNIAADAEFATVNNQQVAKFTIFHTPKDGQGNDKESQPYRVTVFPDRDNKFPNYIANVVASVKKGDYWEVEGTEDISIFQDKNTGQPRLSYNFNARKIYPASIRTAVISVQKNQQGNQGGGQNFNQGNNGGGFNANQGQGQQGFGNQGGQPQGGGFGQQQNQGGGFGNQGQNNGGGFGNQGGQPQGGGFGQPQGNQGGFNANQGQNNGGGFGQQGQNNGGNQGGSENNPWGGGYDAPPF